MSDLTEQNYGFGAGLTALFDHNPGIMPSFIEDVTEPEFNGKRTKITSGKFYKVKTPKGNEFIVYIKFSSKLIPNNNMYSGFMWEFPLTKTEKDKIEAQYQNTGTLLILLVCMNKNNVDLKDQVALLTWENYCKIRYRSNIQIGIWNNPNVKKQGSKVYYLRKGKGQKEEYFLKIKRNLIEKTKLDELCFVLDKENNECKEMDLSDKDEQIIESQYVESEPEDLEVQTEKYIENAECLYIKDNVSWCGKCRCRTNRVNFEYISIDEIENRKKVSIYVYQCPQCNQRYITPKVYEDFIDKTHRKVNIKIRRIRTLVDRVYLTPNYGCVYCDTELSVASCRLKVYENIDKTNKTEKIVDTDLFYCKNCGIYYAQPELHNNLLKQYGRNKVNFINEKFKQQRFNL